MREKTELKKYIGCLFILGLIVITPIVIGKNNFNQKYSLALRGDFIYVGGTGPNNYSSIQSAINDAVNGDTVYVYDDSSPYYENVVVDKSIFLIGENRDTTVIDADSIGNVVIIQADGVRISGFKLINSGYSPNAWDENVIKIVGFGNIVIENNLISIGIIKHSGCTAGIYLKDSSDNLIENNIIFKDDISIRTFGIFIDEGSSFNNISGNEIYGYIDGIYPISDDNTFYNNYIHHNGDGFSNHGYRNKIVNNTIMDNVYQGIGNDNTIDTLISGNTIISNGIGREFDSGINLNMCSNAQIKYNHISNNNPTGVHLLADNNYITDNHISNNKIVGVYANFHYDNVIARNNFIDNDKDAFFEVEFPLRNKNKWDSNYWGRPRILPKMIYGNGYFTVLFRFPWFNFDWHPAKEQYNIP